MKNHAVAINPIDPFFQAMGPALFPDLQYPSINGMDCSGVIVDIGSPATKFKLGDRVAGLAVGGYTGDSIGGSFQSYVGMSKFPF